MERDTFLGAYRRLLIEIRVLARSRVVAFASVRDALLERPFSLPRLLANAPEAEAIAADLRRLKDAQPADGSEVHLDAALQATIREVLDANPSPASGMRGHDAPRGVGSPTVSDSRWISAEIDDHDRTDPLDVGTTYTLAFGVDVQRRNNAVGDAPFDEGALFPAGVDAIELTVELHSDDFDIVAQHPTILVKRTGLARVRARFSITPRRNGRATITAIIHKERNFVQQLIMTLSVGAAQRAEPPVTTALTRPQSTVARIQSRSVMIVMKPAVPSGYDFIARDLQGMKTAHLEVEPDQLASAITAARDTLLEVVQHADAYGDDVFQTRIAIDPPDTDAALQLMARAGSRLFQILFRAPGGSADASVIGDWLHNLLADDEQPISIQILSRRAPIPWAMVYTGDVSAHAKLEWRHFLGFRHVIEQLPMVDQLGQGGPEIASDRPALDVSINVNRKIDDEMGVDWVERQEKFWSDARATHTRLRVTSRTRRGEIIAALADRETTDQIVYFFCHAETAPLGVRGGSDSSSLWLGDAKITLGELNLDAPTAIKLRGNPLVFINACESAELSPLFYDGFVPYFMGKGARGVIGTECPTPGFFAAEWAERFFNRFLRGEPLGAIFLALRREFLEKHGNPLGLLYSVHCDGDTQVSPAL